MDLPSNDRNLMAVIQTNLQRPHDCIPKRTMEARMCARMWFFYNECTGTDANSNEHRTRLMRELSIKNNFSSISLRPTLWNQATCRWVEYNFLHYSVNFNGFQGVKRLTKPRNATVLEGQLPAKLATELEGKLPPCVTLDNNTGHFNVAKTLPISLCGGERQRHIQMGCELLSRFKSYESGNITWIVCSPPRSA